jgi:DeoR/GlpR family transcriptional regulator of sugar metabolism
VNTEARRTFILSEIETRGSVSVTALAEHLDVSEMTIRRDLTDLRNEGLVKRVHGGAVSTRGRSFEPPLLLRTNEHTSAKQRIGACAAELVADGDSIALDVGTTPLEVARHLFDRRNLTLITPNLHIANLFLNRADVRLILPGGILRPDEASLVGNLTAYAFQNLFVDRLFLGVGGINAEVGLTEYNLEDALVKQAMIRSAKEVIVVAEASKFNHIAFAAVAPLEAVHILVTDQPPPAPLAACLKKAGVIVQVAN